MKRGVPGCCGHGSGAEQPLLKTLSFAVLHFSIAFCVAYALTGSALQGGLIALVEPACNTVAFYFHERFWRWRRGRSDPQRGHGHGHLAGVIRSPQAMERRVP